MPYRNGQFEEPDNTDRAEWACEGLEAYAAVTRSNPPEQEVNFLTKDPDEKAHVEEVISDFLSDLHHLTDAAGIDFDEMLERGLGHYVEEVEERKPADAES